MSRRALAAAGRRVAGPRHEYRFGVRQMALLGVLACLLAGVTFALGVVVGREMAGRRLAGAVATPTRTAPAEAARGSALRPEVTGGPTTAARTEERLTFYKALTAPTPDLPPVEKPRIEERLVVAEEPDGGGGGRERPPPPVAPPVARATPVPPTWRAAPVIPAARPSLAASTASSASEAAGWTVQVSSFRSRALADELRARLATRGFDAYVLASGTDEGRARYRVRVGAYPTRAEAERTALELRAERGLAPLVTPRPR